MHRAPTIYRLLLDVLTYVWLLLRPSSAVAAENLFYNTIAGLLTDCDSYNFLSRPQQMRVISP